MKLNFKKISAVMASSFMLVSSVGFAAAASFPTPFVENGNDDFAVVYGLSSLDSIPANTVGNYLSSKVSFDVDSDVTVTYETSDGVSENEIKLGGPIVFAGSNIKSKLTDNKISNLFDGKISWDNGVDDEDYNTHEEIRIDGLEVITTLKDDELDEGVALTNDKGLEYRYVFEEDIKWSEKTDDADDFTINFLGEDMTITDMEHDEVTFTKGDEFYLDRGDTLNFRGNDITLMGVSTDRVRISINGDERRGSEGETIRSNGIEIRIEYVDAGSYQGDYFGAEFTIGDDIETTVSDGDAYFGEDEDDPKWVWSIDNMDFTDDGDGFIGVRYNEREKDADDDLVYVGDSYVFPRNFAQVFFEGVTDVDYEDFELSFDDSMDLYSKGDTSDKHEEDAKVVMLKGETDESFLVSDGTEYETDSIYLSYNGTSVGVYFKDVHEDMSDSVRVRLINEYDLVGVIEEQNISGVMTNVTIGYTLSEDIATLNSDDTIEEVTLNMVLDEDKVIETATISIDDIKVSIEGDNAFEYLGSVKEDAQGSDIKVDGTSIGSREDSVLTNYGVVIRDPEANADSDEVILSVPSEQVYAKVSVLGSDATIISSSINGSIGLDTGSLIVKDNEISSVSNKNQIIVGGSCVNAEAARLLGVPLGTCGEAFTASTGVGPGQYMIKTFTSETNPDKVVVLVAGYHAADTVKGVQDLLASNLTMVAGESLIG